MAPQPQTSHPRTILFVDIDGVLNVGIRDQDAAPVLFNESNRDYALKRRDGGSANASEEACVQRLLSVTQRPLPGPGGDGGASYSDLMCRGGSHISDVLAGRLAAIVGAAGSDTRVVLSSNWRKPAHAARVRRLEQQVSMCMPSGEFVFTDTTRQAEERGAADRLRCIGDYVEQACRGRGGRPLRILILEDFFVTPMDGWLCDGCRIDSVSAAEAYILGRAGCKSVDVKLVHTYDEWHASSGLRIQIGAGLSEHNIDQALGFLAKGGMSRTLGSDGDARAEAKMARRPSTSCNAILLGAVSSRTQVVDGQWSKRLTAAVPKLFTTYLS